jgi:hypothetical protein
VDTIQGVGEMRILILRRKMWCHGSDELLLTYRGFAVWLPYVKLLDDSLHVGDTSCLHLVKLLLITRAYYLYQIFLYNFGVR